MPSTNVPRSGSELVVRRMCGDEVELIREWATAEGWNPGLYDGPCFFQADPEGFFIGEVGGNPVSCISCVRYGASFGFLGQYIVKPDCRGLGYGLCIWQAGMRHLGQRNVGLDGVLQQQGNYERSGFRFANNHIRYQGSGGGTIPAGLVPLSALPFDDLAAYDLECFPARRPQFLRNWISLPGSFGLASAPDGRLAGFGVIRRSVDGYKVGPLYANELLVAESLLRGLFAAASGHLVCVDIPDQSVNPAAAALVMKFGLSESFRTARMYTREAPRIRTERVFGITTMELG